MIKDLLGVPPAAAVACSGTTQSGAVNTVQPGASTQRVAFPPQDCDRRHPPPDTLTVAVDDGGQAAVGAGDNAGAVV